MMQIVMRTAIMRSETDEVTSETSTRIVASSTFPAASVTLWVMVCSPARHDPSDPLTAPTPRGDCTYMSEYGFYTTIITIYCICMI